jgi:NAD+ kinase
VTEETVQSKLSRELRAGASIALLPGLSSPEAQALTPEITRYLESMGVAVRVEPPGPESIKLVVSLGGDGLMMRAARRYPNVPILGINFGHLGFLTAAEASHWRDALERVIEGDFQIREGPTLATTVVSAIGPPQDLGWAVNDVVVHGGLRFIHPTLFIDRQYVNEYPGDGMVVATPAGSTAYCMAAGGPVLLSGVGGLAVVPISCHSPIRVSMVVPADVEIGLKLIGRNGADLILDGQSEQLRPIKPGDMVFVRRGPVSFRQVSFRSFDWFAAFQSKFNYHIRRGGLVPTVPEHEVAG